MARKLTDFTFYKNTPFTDLQNTIYFGNVIERDEFFKTTYEQVTGISTSDFNFIRDRSSLNITIPYAETYGINYCSFVSEFDNIHYYARVVNINYVNDNVVHLDLLIDGVMTFLCGSNTWTNACRNVFVNRSHVPKNVYQLYEKDLRSNNDLLNVHTLEYKYTDYFDFGNAFVVFQSSVDLSKPFGDSNAPKLSTSAGNVHDRISSPVNLYVCKNVDHFKNIMEKMQDFPWITQNFSKILMIPEIMIDVHDLIKVEGDTVDFSGLLYTFNEKTTTKDAVLTDLSQKMLSLIYNCFKIPTALVNSTDKTYAIRSGYTNIELCSYNGQQVAIEPEFLPKDGLSFVGKMVTGYYNEFKIYPYNYKSNEETASDTRLNSYLGTNFNNGLVFNTFDDIPILIDNYKLSLSQNANQRELANSNQFTNRIKNVLTGSSNNGIMGRLMDAVSLTSNVTSLSGLMGGVTSDYEYYRQQKAQFADKAIASPTITAQGTSNNFMMGKNLFGISVRYSRINDVELEKVLRYHGLFGFQFERVMDLQPVNTMSVCNFVQFTGNWTLPNCDTNIFQLIKTQLENGVRFWKNDGTPNPFVNDLLNNNWE